MPHIIRLRGPWECEPLWRWQPAANGSWRENRDELPASRTLFASESWRDLLGDDFCGCVKLLRRFHRPTGIETGFKIWISIPRMQWPLCVFLNHQPLGEVAEPTRGETEELPPARFDIANLLAPQNVLSLILTFPADSSALAGQPNDQGPSLLIEQVQLEIE